MKWKTLEHTPEPPRRQYVTDDRRPERPKPKTPRRQCAWCDTPLAPGHWGETCARRDRRCHYHDLAAGVGVTLPDSPVPMIVRHGEHVQNEHDRPAAGLADAAKPEMLLLVPSLAEIAAQATQERAA